MGSSDLLMVCISAFVAVFILLTLLAGVMRLVLEIFPQKIAKTDAVMMAAVAAVASSIYPGTKVTNIEEIK